MTTRYRFNTAQAAEYSGRAVETVRRALERGDLHGGQRKAHGRWSVRLECLDAWLDGDSCEHQQAAAS